MKLRDLGKVQELARRRNLLLRAREDVAVGVMVFEVISNGRKHDLADILNAHLGCTEIKQFASDKLGLLLLEIDETLEKLGVDLSGPLLGDLSGPLLGGEDE